jgi:uncharacterized protein (DUF885 family)
MRQRRYGSTANKMADNSMFQEALSAQSFYRWIWSKIDMNNLIAAMIPAMFLLGACGNDATQSNGEPIESKTASSAEASAAVAELVEAFFERGLERNPLRATFIGDYRYDDRLANRISPQYIAESRAIDREYLEKLASIDSEALSGQDRLTYDMFKLDREMALEGEKFPSHLIPVNQFRSFPNSFIQLGSGSSAHQFKTVKNYDDFLSRMDDFVVYMDQIIMNMRVGVAEGIVNPRVLMQKVLPQLSSQIIDDAEKSTFYAPIRNMPGDFSREDRERLTAAYIEAIVTTVIPAYKRVYDYIRDEYMPETRETVGLADLPGGKEWYEFLVRRTTTTNLTADEIHQIGLAEVARIHSEMQNVMDEVGFTGDRRAFFDFLNNDEQFYFERPDQLIQGYRDMSDRVSSLTPELFSIFPKSGFEVRRTESFREQSAAGGNYRRGTPDGSRSGIFFANAYDIKARPIWAMEALFLHEAIPGHHFQISIQQELENLPRFRRFGRYTAFSEGWGLYAELLGKELGVYTDPYQYFGALNAELWRAIRLVVDTGLHAKGWSRDDVLNYMYENSAVKEARAISEAERYIAAPSQALAYKVGQLKIRELRDRAEHALGEDFDVREFHRAVLSDGAVPLATLETKIDRWIGSRM